MIVIGLTGSIGMGKSTTLDLFAAEGVPVYSADAAVHALYAGKAAPLIEAAFPGSVIDGRVDREQLSAKVIGRPEALKQLESIVHPLVREAETGFVADAKAAGATLAVLDIPLLFETGGQARVDKVVVVTADPQIQRQRVLARPGMSAQKLDAILARQLPDAEKRRRADFVIDTSLGLDHARTEVRRILADLKGQPDA